MKKEEITGQVIGSLDEGLRVNYSRTLAETLVKEHGRDFCISLLKALIEGSVGGGHDSKDYKR